LDSAHSRRRQLASVESLGGEIKWRRPHVAFRVIAYLIGDGHQVVYQGLQAVCVPRGEFMFELPLRNEFEYSAGGNELNLLIIQRAHLRLQFVWDGPLSKRPVYGQQHCQ